ncbi:hypothetical protein RI129_012578 [Pyrocoelia pectoralis]|uniref:UDP-glucuronosyltransferase n=1 Tax=Pyrocoelia pectoralis TaxID=417401 RepID=A0AAN7V2K6_9COLE
MVGVFVILCMAIHCSTTARILGIISFPSYSHQIAFQPLWRELSLRGHQVTTLTTDSMNDPELTNLTEIDLNFSYDAWTSTLSDFVKSTQTNFIKGIGMTTFTIQEFSRLQLEYSEVQRLIRSDASFDLVIVEYHTPSMFAFAERFSCPHIGVLSLDPPSSTLKSIGHPVHPVLYPDFMLSFTGHSTLLERLKSVAYSTFAEMLYYHYLYSIQQQHVERFFGSNYSSLKEIAKNASLFFMNTDPVFHKVKPLLPNVIQIGGGSYRIPTGVLPHHLMKLLDSASEGVIYFSLGSNVKSEDLSSTTRNLILETFGELPYTVLWKFESENMPNRPKNVHISKWYPQQNLLKHPNVKLFITQGGLQSMNEAIYAHVPMIVMPFYADQFFNAKRILERGVGISLDYTKLQKEDFKSAIIEVITNHGYKKKLKKLAELASDQPMTGIERAIWWTEYVIRHKGAKHLRSPYLDIPFYQYYLMDIILSLFLLFLVFLGVVYISLMVAKRVYLCKHNFKVKVE